MSSWSARAAIAAITLCGFVVACGSRAEDGADSSESDLSSPTFDKNNVMDDATLNDARAVDTAHVQQLLEKTPFTNFFLLHTASPLATYREGGKLASEILSATAVKYAINPIELLTAIEAEQSLISATEPSDDIAKLAFRCGCPDGDECKVNPGLYIGFTKQAECYGATLRASLDAQAANLPTKSGWKRGASRLSDDGPTKLLVTPVNMATAALYGYTPVVGKGGGGDAALGGVSKHWELFGRFAKALSYKGPAAAGAGGGTLCATSAECGATTPVCDPVVGRCAACASDHGSAVRPCASVDSPACLPSGACVACSATNATACAKSTATPVCVVAQSTCGCTNDASCGAGKLCNPSLGPAGLCSDGCRVVAGKDSCGATAKCDKVDGTIGMCHAITCASSGCPGALVCDSATAPATCVECTPIQVSACKALGTGAACVDHKCGCAADADCGGGGRTCDLALHVCKAVASTPGDAADAGPPPDTTLPPTTSQLPSTGEPPSGHGTNDHAAAPKAEPQFAPVNPPPAGAGVGCHASPRGPGGAAGSLLALAAFALAFARRSRQR